MTNSNVTPPISARLSTRPPQLPIICNHVHGILSPFNSHNRVLAPRSPIQWIFTTIGFFSVVQKDGDSHLTVRARVRDDLVNLRQICPSLSRPIHTPRADYSWRSTISHQEWSEALAHLGKEIDYHNFKSEVERRQGKIRAGLYSRVWALLLELAGLDVRCKP